MEFLVGAHVDNVGIEIARWLSDKQKLPIIPPYSAICWFKDQNPVAAALFTEYTGSSIKGHFYGPNLLTKQVMANTYRYVFNQLGCSVFIAQIPRNNKFKKLLPRMGFKYIAVVPNYFGHTKDGDAIMYALKRDAANRWMK